MLSEHQYIFKKLFFIRNFENLIIFLIQISLLLLLLLQFTNINTIFTFICLVYFIFFILEIPFLILYSPRITLNSDGACINNRFYMYDELEIFHDFYFIYFKIDGIIVGKFKLISINFCLINNINTCDICKYITEMKDQGYSFFKPILNTEEFNKEVKELLFYLTIWISPLYLLGCIFTFFIKFK